MSYTKRRFVFDSFINGSILCLCLFLPVIYGESSITEPPWDTARISVDTELYQNGKSVGTRRFFYGQVPSPLNFNEGQELKLTYKNFNTNVGQQFQWLAPDLKFNSTEKEYNFGELNKLNDNTTIKCIIIDLKTRNKYGIAVPLKYTNSSADTVSTSGFSLTNWLIKHSTYIYIATGVVIVLLIFVCILKTIMKRRRSQPAKHEAKVTYADLQLKIPTNETTLTPPGPAYSQIVGVLVIKDNRTR